MIKIQIRKQNTSPWWSWQCLNHIHGFGTPLFPKGGGSMWSVAMAGALRHLRDEHSAK